MCYLPPHPEVVEGEQATATTKRRSVPNPRLGREREPAMVERIVHWIHLLIALPLAGSSLPAPPPNVCGLPALQSAGSGLLAPPPVGSGLPVLLSVARGEGCRRAVRKRERGSGGRWCAIVLEKENVCRQASKGDGVPSD